MTLGYIFYRLTPYVLSCSVHFLTLLYLFHIVERYNTVPWYTIVSGKNLKKINII